jgi:hypothetical protein
MIKIEPQNSKQARFGFEVEDFDFRALRIVSGFELRVSDFLILSQRYKGRQKNKNQENSRLKEIHSMASTICKARRGSGSAWRLIVVLVGMLITQPAMTLAAQAGFEPPTTLNASQILPPDVLSGPHHRVEERVYNDGYLNRYTVLSKFGGFVAVSTPMLRKRISEINAMVRMKQIQGTKEFAASLKEAGTDTLAGFKNLVTKPVDTVKGAVSGLAVAFRRAGDAITGPKRSDAEDSRVKDLIGFSKTKREYAHQLGVDVYTDNEKLQDRLNSIAWAGYGGGLTWAAAMSAVPGGAGLAITISGTHKLLNEVFRTTPRVDLRRMKAEKLSAMDVHLEIADAFLNNTVYSPRYQTLLVQPPGRPAPVALMT